MDRKYDAPKGRIPEWCPFCYAQDAVKWTEFRVDFTEMRYFDGKNDKGECGQSHKVFCTRCDEEIREEDVWEVD